MTTPSEQTRNESYASELPLVGSKRVVIRSFVAVRGKSGATREEIADGTGFRLSCVCGRVRELLDEGELVESGTSRFGVSGKRNAVVVAKEFGYGVSNTVAEGCSPSVSQTNREGGSRDIGQRQVNKQPAASSEVRDLAGNRPAHTGTKDMATSEPHSITKQLAALKESSKPEQLDLFS